MPWTCTYCHALNPDTVNQCEKCGTLLSGDRQSPPVENPRNDVADNADATHRYRAGDTINDRYKVIEPVGRGGMGIVYRVHDMTLNEEAALKLMGGSLARDVVYIDRFRNEARVARQLSHPNIVRVHDIGNFDGDLYISMEFVRGRSLRAILQRCKATGQPIPAAQIIDIMIHVCDALDYAHQFTVHRDIKPENIMITESGQVKLMDFGLSKLITAPTMTVTATAMGTPMYMAPEQFRDSARVDHRADIFSVGMMMYELFTGQIPSGMAKPASQIRSDVPPAIDYILSRCTAAEPENRYSSAGEVRDALRAALFKMSEKMSVGESAQRKPRKRKRPVLIILAIVAVTAVCLAAGAIWNVRQRPVRDAQKALAELNAIQRSVDALPTIDPDKYKQAAAARKTATDLMAQHQFQKAAEEYRRAAAIFATILDGPKPTAKQQTPKKPAPPSSKSSGSTEKPQATISQTAVPPRLRMAIRRTTALHDRALEINADKVVPDMLKQAETLLTAAEQSRNQKNFEKAQTGYDNAVKLLAKIVAETEAARNAPEGMAYVPSGQFVMGSAKGGPNERPESSVNLSGFYIDTYEVSVNDFKKFLLDTNRPMPAAWRANPFLVAQPNLPACGVTWNDALDYTLWIGKRLPTEAEWEKAARGTAGLVYPWGNSWEKGMANASGVIFDEYPGFAPVTGLLWSKSPYGCCNMAGNAIEWVSSLYKPYPYNAKDGRENLYVQGPRVLRGGSCRTEPPKATLRTTSRFSADPRDTRMLPGFRCAKNAVLPAMLKPVRSTQQKPTGFEPISTKTRS